MKKKGLNPVYMGKSAGDLVGKSWRAMKKKNTKQMLDIMNAAVAMWGKQAKKQQAKLSSLPVKSAARKYEALNTTGLIVFIMAETYAKKGMKAEAKKYYQLAKKDYSYSQAWDRKGWWWAIAKGCDKKMARLK